jgi:hypothetical protein
VRAKLVESAEKFRAIDQRARSVLGEAAPPSPERQPQTRRRLLIDSAPYVVAVSIFWLLAFLHGFEGRAIGVATAFSALFLLVWYFETRSASRHPSRLETALAWLWLVFRTVIGAVGALFFLGVPITAVVLVLADQSFPDAAMIFILVVGLLLGLLCLWIGFAGWSRSPVRDLQLRKHRRQRYGWPL